jgi:DNA mismatch repair protein MutL
MGKIEHLSDSLIRQIAAGEVIAEPMSVVKEAIENSIDAEAKEIHVDIKNGGITNITIADDGIGISREDLFIATSRHSTSKLHSEVDLQTILTLGFRGEFLASLLAAADITIVSKAQDSNQAFKAFYSIDKDPIIENTSRTRGTTLIVENLFEKVPARRNFLPKAKTSSSRIHELVRQFTLETIMLKYSEVNLVIRLMLLLWF